MVSKIVKNRTSGSLLSGLKFAQKAKNRMTGTLFSGLKYVKIGGNRARSSLLSGLHSVIEENVNLFWSQICLRIKKSKINHGNNQNLSNKLTPFWSQIRQNSQKLSKPFTPL